jgi:hypothetical protein
VKDRLRTIWHDHGVVLGTQIGLYSLTEQGRSVAYQQVCLAKQGRLPVIDVLAGFVASNK